MVDDRLSENGLHIRVLRRNDAAICRVLRLEGLRLHPEAFGTSFEEEESRSEAEFAARIPESPPDVLFGAFLNADPEAPLVGMAGLRVQSRLKERHKATLYGMYVNAAARGRGVARGLIDRIIAHARDTPGIEIIQLVVTTENAAARALYDSAGFVVYGIERRSLRIAPGCDLDDELRALDLMAPPSAASR